jgi:hypothetical protein
MRVAPARDKEAYSDILFIALTGNFGIPQTSSRHCSLAAVKATRIVLNFEK